MNTQNFLKVRVARGTESSFFEFVGRIARKMKKIGFELSWKKVGTQKVAYPVGPGVVYEITTDIYEFNIPRNVTVGKENVEFVGLITIRKGIRQVSKIAEGHDDVVLGEIPVRCDKCGTNRRRVKYFVFKENGDVKVLGKNCAEEYFGINLTKSLEYWSRYADARVVSSRGGTYEIETPTVYEIVAITLFALDRAQENGDSIEWKDLKRTIYNLQYVTNTVIDSLPVEVAYDNQQINKELNNFVKANHHEIEDIVAQLYARARAMKPKTDFEYNVRNNLIASDGAEIAVPRSVPIVAWFAYDTIVNAEKREAHRRKREQEKLRKQQIKARFEKGQFIAPIGERIEVDVTLGKVEEREGNWGAYYIVRFETDEGYKLIWFTNNPFDLSRLEIGDRLRIRATVKEHNHKFFNTKIQRVSIVKKY